MPTGLFWYEGRGPHNKHPSSSLIRGVLADAPYLRLK